MKTVQLNLGLNNNPYSEDQITAYFKLNSTFTYVEHRLDSGEYQGEVEPTFVVLLKVKDKLNQSHLLRAVEELCTLFMQDMIPMVTTRMKVMCYNDNYKGEEIMFNSKYFKYYDTSKKR